MSDRLVTDSETGAAVEQILSVRPPVISEPGLPMGGMENAKVVLGTWLADNLPAYIVAGRAIMSVPAATSVTNLLPDVGAVLTYEPPALDASNLETSYTAGATALLYVSCMRLTSLKMIGIGPSGDPEWWATYPMQIITWVKSQNWADTIAASNNLITAVRSCLLSGGHFGLDRPDYIKLDPNSYSENATEPELVQGNRHVRPAVANISMALRETMITPPLGVTSEVTVNESILSEFSTLPDRAIFAGPFGTQP
jgi:hypothetical protein